MAAGNDGGGSIRIPAACCGLFGLRPSRGRVSSRREPGRLRIGFTTASPIGTEVHPEAVEAVRRTVDLLRRLGHEVEAAAPDIDGLALATSFLHIYYGQVPAAVAHARALGARGDIELMSRILVTLGNNLPASALTVQLGKWNEYARALGRFHQRFDMLLTPTLAHPPIRHGAGDPSAAEKRVLGFLHGSGLLAVLARLGLLDSTVKKIAEDSLRYVPFTQLANLTGTPAMTVPLHWSADGLPLGVQFNGPFGSEDRLLQLAHQLEQAKPWFERLPGWVTHNTA